MFQYSAKHDLLQRVDYLSTVSGGGYFGGFFSALFSRGAKWVDVKNALADDSEQVQYLRRNGRYLAPAGTQDLLLGLAVLFRNWVAVLLVMGSSLLSFFLFLEWLALLTSDWEGLEYALTRLGFDSGLLAALGAVLGTAASGARRLTVKLGEKPDGKRSRGWPAALQYVAGGSVALMVFVMLSATASWIPKLFTKHPLFAEAEAPAVTPTPAAQAPAVTQLQAAESRMS